LEARLDFSKYTIHTLEYIEPNDNAKKNLLDSSSGPKRFDQQHKVFLCATIDSVNGGAQVSFRSSFLVLKRPCAQTAALKCLEILPRLSSDKGGGSGRA
jgi:hypothetical protein